MPDAKYGRLFTERDVEFLLVAMGAAPDFVEARRLLASNLEVLDAQAGTPNAPTFPADEPLFLLRGQDQAAPAIAPIEALGVVFRWDYWLSAKDDGASPEFLAAVQAAATAMRAWQRIHRDRVKVPD